jgi:hypothetical protein
MGVAPSACERRFCRDSGGVCSTEGAVTTTPKPQTTPKPTVQHCKWADATLYQDAPLWLDAWNTPWTCRRDGDQRLIEETDECLACPRWERRNGVDLKPPPRT